MDQAGAHPSGCVWHSGKCRRSRLDDPQLTEERNCRREVGLILLLELLGPHVVAGVGDGVDSLLLGTGH